jgi:SpoVK/Ycf46/Vps4 family AAA+-type ATPase
MAAEAIGYDLGRPIKVVNCAQLVSKWVGESAKNIQAVFDEAKAVDAILVFDEAEGLFGSRSGSEGSSGRHDDMNVGILLHHIETFSGVVVVITNLKDRIDNAFFRRFKFVLEFPLPSAEERLRLWRLLIPKEAPLSANVDLNYLANQYDGFTGGNIKTAVFRAASRAALRAKLDQRVITMEDLKKAAEEESGKDLSKKAGANSMFS